MRPITNFVETASKYRSQVFVIREDQKVNGKSPIGLLGLAAEQGTQLVLEAQGDDAQQVLDALVALINQLPQIEERDMRG